MPEKILNNPENWEKAVGKIISKFEQLYSDVADIQEEFETGLNKDELIELQSRANRYLTYLTNFIDDFPRNMREITENQDLKEEYSYNAAENLRTKLIDIINKIDAKLSRMTSNQNAGIRSTRRHKRSTRRHKRSTRRDKKSTRRDKKSTRRHKRYSK